MGRSPTTGREEGTRPPVRTPPLSRPDVAGPADEEYQARRKADDEFTAWRKEWARKVPELCARVFALRKTGYWGCGFHWGMEKDLGYLMNRLNDYDSGAQFYGPMGHVHQHALRLALEMFLEQVARAEHSSKWYVGLSADPKNPGIISGPFDERPELAAGHFLYQQTLDPPEWHLMGGSAAGGECEPSS